MESSTLSLIDEYDHVNEFIFYTPTNIPGKGCDTNLFNFQISSCCSCTDGCISIDSCSCLRGSGEVNYQNRLLVNTKFISSNCENGGCLVECGSRCKCDSSKCENRVVQFGPVAGLNIENFEAKGYGLISTKPLLKGQFVCEYAGEIIGEEEAIKRRAGDSTNYIFTLNEFVGDQKVRTIVDATCIANIGRYINHSCDPNCIVIPVRVDSVCPRLCIFTLKDIRTGEEITYNYGNADNYVYGNVDLSKLKVCLCESDKCSKYLPFKS